MSEILARVVRVESFEESTAAALATAVNEWLAALGEERFIASEFHTDGTTFWCFITYAEE